MLTVALEIPMVEPVEGLALVGVVAVVAGYWGDVRVQLVVCNSDAFQG